MKKIGILAISFSFLLIITGCSSELNSGKTYHSYYADSQTGDDKNSGTSPDQAWKSLQRIEEQKLEAGDLIYLSGSSHFQGSLKLINIEGTEESPVEITSYGKGQTVIESGDSLAILATNCKYLKIKNIQVLGSGRLNGNSANGIELVDCMFSEIDSVTASGYLISGIRITGGNNIRITNSYTYDNGFCGINVESGEPENWTDGSSYKTMKRLYIGHCIAENNPGSPVIKDNHSGNGILIGGVTNGIIEYCEAMNNGWDMPREGNGPVGIWAYMCDSVIIQHCYSHHNKTSAKGKDGGGFDFDGGMRYSVMQYNLSAFNEGAGYGIFQYSGAGDWHDNIARYNISYNDGSKNGQCGILVWCDPAASAMYNFHAYNNTIVNNCSYGVNFEPGAYKGFLFENNIMQVTAATEKFIGGNFTLSAFDRNLYWSDINAANGKPQPKVVLDKKALYSDPELNLPPDSILLNNTLYPSDLKYFYLNDGSVCRKSGNVVPGNGGFDFWSNIIPGVDPNIGAWQGRSTLQAQRQTILFDSGWKFHRGGAQYAEQPGFDDSSWRKVYLPHDWSIEDLPGTNSPFNRDAISQVSGGFTTGGTGWYRKTFAVPEEQKNKRIVVLFEGIYMNSEIWINGVSIGSHPYGYTSFWFDITDKVKFGSENILAVKVRNEGENSRWYSGSGIYRHVWLKVLDQIHVAQWGTSISTPEVTASSAKVNIKTSVINRSDNALNIRIVTRILDSKGIETSKSESEQPISRMGESVFNQDVVISNPDLWSTETPFLYQALSEVFAGDRMVDQVVTNFGIRTIKFDAVNGFQLNGKAMKLKGGCFHHDNGPLGAKSYDRAEERKVELLKASGFNAIRCSHNPPAPAFLDACDRLGMLVIDEAFDMWQHPKNPYDYSLFFEKWWQKDILNMILRDRNHPCIILWSIGNEIPGMDSPEVVKTAGIIADFVRKSDPSRPVIAAVNNLNPAKDPFFSTLDVGGYNYGTGGGGIRDSIFAFDHGRIPSRIMIQTESYPLEAFKSWMDVTDNPCLLGDFVWTAFDYIGEASIGWLGYMQTVDFYPWNLAFCGDIDICGWKRPQSYYRDALWKDGQISLFVKPPEPSFKENTNRIAWSKWHWDDAVADWNWKGYEKKPLEVSVYSSCDEAELYLNNKSLGRKKTNRDSQFRAVWEVPYQEGELKAVGYKGKKKVNSATLRTAGDIVSLKLSADRAEIKADNQDLTFITVELIDNAGNRNPKAENLLKFEIDGPGKIVGVGNANPVSIESSQLPQRKAWQGRCLVIIKSENQPGNIRLKVRSDELTSKELTITSSLNIP